MPATIAIVGAGRLGRALGRRLRQLDWKIGAVVTQSAASARAAVRAIGAGHPQAAVGSRVLLANIILIATPDSAIHEVACELARIGGDEWRRKIVLHASGALGESELAPLARRGAFTGSMHPLQTFSGRIAAPLEGVVFATEGDPHAQRAARRIARAVGGIPISLTVGAKPAYHLAGTFSSPYLLAIIGCSIRILMRSGFSRRRAKIALLPLIRQTLANFERFGAYQAWTGPIARGDFSTISRHQSALANWPREIQDAYVALARLSSRLLAPHPEATLRHLDRILKNAGRRPTPAHRNSPALFLKKRL